MEKEKQDRGDGPEIRSARARLGGLAKSARYEPRELTRGARAGFLARFQREADPEGKLDPVERRRRAEALLRAHMLRLAMASAKARRARRAK